MRSKEVERAIKNFENCDKLISIHRPKDITIENPQDFNKDVETVLKYISQLEKETDELKIEKNNLINERDKLIEEYNKTGEFASNQIYREKNYINKQIIRDKINEIEENIKNILKEIEWAKEVKDKAYLKACRDIYCRLYGEKQLLEEIIGE